MTPHVFVRSADGTIQRWERAAIGELKQKLPPDAVDGDSDEAWFEAILVQQPELLGLATPDDDSDFEGPLVCLQQRAVPALNGRTIYPDIVILAASGHVAVVEVKLGRNPELRDRRVVAQVLEYAASLAQCSEDQLLAAIAGKDHRAGSWPDFIQQLFPTAPDSDRLARRFLSRFRDQDLLLAIACDAVPVGLRELVVGVIGQTAIGDYRFRVIEIAPFVSPREAGDVVLLPAVKCETEIVARTSVTVSHEEGQPRPGVSVEVTTLEEAEAHRLAAVERAEARRWDEPSFFEDALARLGGPEGDDRADQPLTAIREMYEAVADRHRISWSKSKCGGFNVRIEGVSPQAVLSVYANGELYVNFGCLEPADASEARAALTGMKGLRFPDKGNPRVDGWPTHWRAILEVFERLSR